MKKLGLVFAVLLLMACGDDDSWSPSDADNSRSSLVVLSGGGKGNSSSVNKEELSSSSVILSGDSHEGSSDSRSSDSKGNSSSSVAKTFRVRTIATPCKTKTEDNCEYDSLTDERDGRIYKTVKIGAQWWMAENLSYETENSSCYHDSAKCVKYGRFYTWGAAVGKSEDECLGLLCDLPAEGVRGVCPQGWHLPSYAEWDDLRIAVGGKTAGSALKSQTGWNMTDGTDAFGFTALPGGYLWSTGTFGNDGEFAFFWSATARNEYYAYEMELGSARGYALIDEGETTRYRFSVRCIKD